MFSVPSLRPRILLCAGDPRWESAWRRADAAAPIIRAASLDSCRTFRAVAPASVVVLELPHVSPAEVLAWLAERPRWRDDGMTILLGDASLEPARFQLLECGADLVVTNERQVPEAAKCARRHLAHWDESQLTFRERVWAKLPWEKGCFS
jgi:hypothetical protein